MGSYTLPCIISSQLCPNFCTTHSQNTCFLTALASLFSCSVQDARELALNSLWQCLQKSSANSIKRMQMLCPLSKKNSFFSLVNVRNLLHTINNSMMLIALIFDSICLMKKNMISLYFWVNNIPKISQHGETNKIPLLFHVINEGSQLLFYVGKK